VSGNGIDTWEIWERGNPANIVRRYTCDMMEKALKKTKRRKEIPSAQPQKRFFLYSLAQAKAMDKKLELEGMHYSRDLTADLVLEDDDVQQYEKEKRLRNVRK
jgi:hypothetical protein